MSVTCGANDNANAMICWGALWFLLTIILTVVAYGIQLGGYVSQEKAFYIHVAFIILSPTLTFLAYACRSTPSNVLACFFQSMLAIATHGSNNSHLNDGRADVGVELGRGNHFELEAMSHPNGNGAEGERAMFQSIIGIVKTENPGVCTAVSLAALNIQALFYPTT